VHVVNYGHLGVSATNWRVFYLQAAVVLGLSLLVGKYRRVFELDLRRGAPVVFKIAMASLLLLSLIIVGMHWMHFSRAMSYGPLLLLAALELAALAALGRRSGSAKGAAAAPSGPGRAEDRSFHQALLVIDVMLLAAAVGLVSWLKRGGFDLTPADVHILFFTAGLWWGASMVTHKFDKNNFNDFFTAIGPAVRSAFFMAATLALLVYLLRVGPVSRFQAFAPVLMLLCLEAVVFGLYVNYRTHGRPDGDINDPAMVREMIAAQAKRRPLTPAPPCPVTDPVTEKLRHALDFFDPQIFAMLSAKVPLAAKVLLRRHPGPRSHGLAGRDPGPALLLRLPHRGRARVRPPLLLHCPEDPCAQRQPAPHLRPPGAAAPRRPGRPAHHGVQVPHHVPLLRVSAGVRLRPQRPGRRRQVQGRFPGDRLGRLHAAHLARRAAHALYNWARGDLQLLALRRRVKPGLLPPFYADMPRTLEEIQASERRYLEAYLERPLRTQLRYFFRSTL